jgi:dihydrofolate reductase
MRKLIVTEFVSLDDVLQSPASPDEDTEGGFAHGGWQPQYFDEIMLAAASEGMAETDAYLFGRKTYQKMAAYWPTAPTDDPFTEHLNSTVKYVASTTLESVEWKNTVLIDGDVAEQVAKLKEQPGKNIAVLGSGDLVRTLINNDLVDEYSLFVCPLVLGSGKRLFGGVEPVQKLTLVGSRPTGTGTLMLTYRPER